MTKYTTPSMSFRLSEEDKQLMRELAKLLRTSQVMAIRLVLREVVPALKAVREKKPASKAQSRQVN